MFMWDDAFMQRALLVALFLGPMCGLLGVFVTARRMSFFSDTVAHAALAGVALGLWFGFVDPTIPMILFSLVVAGAMLWLKEQTDLLTDTVMALLLSGSVALGLVVLGMLKGYRQHLDRYLFGDIFSVGWTDVWTALAASVSVMTLIFLNLNSLTLLSTHEDLAHVSGIPVKRLNYLFIFFLTVTVALSIRLLGIMLVTSLVVIPPAAARSLARNLRQQIILSLLIGLLASGGGVALSFPLDKPGGPTITLTLVGVFFASLVISRIRSNWRSGVQEV